MLAEGLVSTIIPVYNRPTLLRQAVESVLAQSYRPIEIVIVDDGSTDPTSAVAADLQSQHSREIQVVRTSNGGPGAAREVGRQLVHGEYVQYLDSDDLLAVDKFERQVAGLRQSPDCDISYGPTLYHEADGSLSDTPLKRTGESIQTLLPSILMSRWWDTSTPLYRRSLTDKGGPWTSLRTEEDWEYDCRLGQFARRLHYCTEFVSITRSHEGARLSSGGSRDIGKLRDRAVAHELILCHAKKAAIAAEVPEMQHFSRELFLLSRQCGAAGLGEESKRLFHLARDASLPHSGVGIDYRAYLWTAQALGWRATGWLACRLDALRQ